jgi:hypothetical protein
MEEKNTAALQPREKNTEKTVHRDSSEEKTETERKKPEHRAKGPINKPMPKGNGGPDKELQHEGEGDPLINSTRDIPTPNNKGHGAPDNQLQNKKKSFSRAKKANQTRKVLENTRWVEL